MNLYALISVVSLFVAFTYSFESADEQKCVLHPDNVYKCENLSDPEKQKCVKESLQTCLPSACKERRMHQVTLDALDELGVDPTTINCGPSISKVLRHQLGLPYVYLICLSCILLVKAIYNSNYSQKLLGTSSVILLHVIFIVILFIPSGLAHLKRCKNKEDNTGRYFLPSCTNDELSANFESVHIGISVIMGFCFAGISLYMIIRKDKKGKNKNKEKFYYSLGLKILGFIGFGIMTYGVPYYAIVESIPLVTTFIELLFV